MFGFEALTNYPLPLKSQFNRESEINRFILKSLSFCLSSRRANNGSSCSYLIPPVTNMSRSLLERYQKLGLRHSLPSIYLYPFASQELSFILRRAYSNLPKNLQAIIFQDILTAFRLLPQIRTQSAASSAHLLLRSVEATLPKQKKHLALTEFKHAIVMHKRHEKACQEKEDSAQLPHDVLVHIFTFLDMQSLVNAGLVCWSWNLAAGSEQLWKLQYTILFGDTNDKMKARQQKIIIVEDENCPLPQEEMTNKMEVDWKEKFKRAYNGTCTKKLSSNRGFCKYCKSVVWLKNMRCSIHSENQGIKPLTASQVVEYLLDDAPSLLESSSDSDSDSDGETISRLWAYPRHMKRN